MPIRLNSHLERATSRTATTNPNPSKGPVGTIPTPPNARKFTDVFSFAEDATTDDTSDDGHDLDNECGEDGDCPEENSLTPKLS
jgi:hypothetical protein